jgi:hypothetical protein
MIGTIVDTFKSIPLASKYVKDLITLEPVPPIPKTYNFDII